MFWLKGSYGRRYRRPTGRNRSVFIVASVSVLIVAATLSSAQMNVALPIERRPVTFDLMEGKYDFYLSGDKIGTSEFSYAESGDFGQTVRETANFSSPSYQMLIEGETAFTYDGRPVFLNMTIRKDGDAKNFICVFGTGSVKQKTGGDGGEMEVDIRTSPDTFLVANNMISHWAVLFGAARLDMQNTYIARIYSPNIATEIVRPLKVERVETIRIASRDYETYVFDDSAGNLFYVTPEGLLLKIVNGDLVIVTSKGEQAPGLGMFR